MSLGGKFRFLALAACLPGMAVLAGCATGGGDWDQPSPGRKEPPEENPYLEFMQEWNATWEEAYGLGPGELMGPFWIEPEGPPKNKAVYLGPYFAIDDPEESPPPYRSLILQFSMSGLNNDNPPAFITGSLLLCSDLEDVPEQVVGLAGFYYSAGRDAWDRSRPEGMGAITEIGMDMGLRMYALAEIPGNWPFVILGCRFGVMGWSYISMGDDDDSDGLGDYNDSGYILTGAMYLGLGMPLVRVGPIDLGMNATLGFRGLALENESPQVKQLFSENQTEIKMNIEASFPF